MEFSKMETRLDCSQGGALLYLETMPGLVMPEEFVYAGTTWLRREVCHVTLIGHAQHLPQRIQKVARTTKNEAKRRMRGMLEEAGEGLSFHVTLEEGIGRVAKQYHNPDHVRETLVAPAKVTNAEVFFERLNRRLRPLGINIGFPPLHVTLYTKNDPYSGEGIGFTDPRDLAQRFQPLDVTGVPREIRRLLFPQSAVA